MQPDKSLRPRSRMASFGHAFRGIKSLIAQEPNAKLHLVATLAVLVLGFYYRISRGEWMALIIVIAIVWLAEAFNTCIEMLCDLWTEGAFHPQVKRIKDIAAGAVLLSALAAAVTGLLIFLK
ncbi:MAG: diacylglycerol kinase family protein [Bacteroidetes bacterium]|nr:diacylglycerol kinase family protein [Bacteroidota bacterium]MBS1629294.1 diacylglycerol kinase family protein [Bacteroidota bacterium]